MEVLNTYCFTEIFNHLHLSDLFNLRQLSRRLKQEVDDHLLTVRSLPLYLTTPRTPEAREAYRILIRKHNYNPSPENPRDAYRFCPLSFGTSSPEAFEDGTILQNQDHFRPSDFLVINNSSALTSLLSFMQKQCPNIEKLAVVIDHFEYYRPQLAEIFKAFPAVKVLLVESTLQDSCRYDADGPISPLSQFLDAKSRNQVILPSEVYNSILKMEKLEELYFFSKQASQLQWTRGDAEILNFVENMLRKLEVFHYNTHDFGSRTFQLPFDEMFQTNESYGQIKELAFADVRMPVDWLGNEGWLLFPALKKLILLDLQSLSFWCLRGVLPIFPVQTLKVLDITLQEIDDSFDLLWFLSKFSMLERFHFRKLVSWGDHKLFPKEFQNRTIKHLKVIEGPETVRERNDAVRWYTENFLSLETCTFIEPEYHVIRVSDLHN